MELRLGKGGNPILDQFSEDGFVDLTFRITGLQVCDAHYRFHLGASFNDCDVGFDVALVKGINGGFDGNMDLIQDHVYREGVRFFRSGEESDRLVAAIRDLYGVSLSARRMVTKESFTVIALHQGDLDFESDCIKLKLFGNDGEPFNEDDYYESFFNVDLGNRMVYWNEKDTDYRAPLLRALGSA